MNLSFQVAAASPSLCKTQQQEGRNHPHVVPAATKKITKFHVRKCGEMTCAINVIQKNLSQGQRPQVQVFFVNNSTTIVKAVHMEIEQRLVSNNNSSIIATKKFSKSTFPLNIPKNTRLDRRTVQKIMADPKTKQRNQEQVNKQCNVATNAFRMAAIPDQALDLTKVFTTIQERKFFTAAHTLKIILQTEAFYSNPVFAVPIAIFASSKEGETTMGFQEESETESHSM